MVKRIETDANEYFGTASKALYHAAGGTMKAPWPCLVRGERYWTQRFFSSPKRSLSSSPFRCVMLWLKSIDAGDAKDFALAL